MATKRKSSKRRGRAIRTDATVGTTRKKIEEDFKLPPGCVVILLPNGKKARSDKEIEALLKDWGY